MSNNIINGAMAQIIEVSEMVNPFETKQIITLKELEESGYGIARLENNRTIDAANVKAKKKSIIEIGGAVSPITIVPATKAVEQGLKIVDFRTGIPAPPEKYFVLADGQHRYKAILELKEQRTPKECSFMLPLVDEIGITKLLTIMNNEVKKWSGADYPNMAIMTLKEKTPRLIAEIASLTNKGYELRSAYQYLTFDKTSLTASEISRIANKEKISTETQSKIDNVAMIGIGKNILSELENKFSGDKILKGRLFSDWMIGKYNSLQPNDKGQIETNMITFFQSLTSEQVKEIKEIKGERGGKSKVENFNQLLNRLYEQFEQSKQVA